MSPFLIRDGSPWLIREDAYRAYCHAAAQPQPRAGLVPGQSPAPSPWSVAAESPGYDLINSVAVIPVYGPIYRHSAYVDDLFAWALGGVSIDRLSDALRAATNDPEARSILFTFDSPGGQAAGVGELAGLIREAGAVKPVAAYVEAACFSAAYYLAAACGEITAAPGSFTGSVGVVIVALDDSKFQDMIGIKEIPIVSSQSPDKWADPATEEGLALYQRMVNDLADVFIADIARFRGVPASTVLSDFGRGGVMIASEARRAGLIDRVGTFDEVVTKLGGRNRARLAVRRPAATAVAQSTVPFPAPVRARFVPQRA